MILNTLTFPIQCWLQILNEVNTFHHINIVIFFYKNILYFQYLCVSVNVKMVINQKSELLFQTVMGLLGIFGNMVSVVVLTSADMKNSFNLLLSCLAIIDILFIILAVLDYSIARGE